MAPTPPGYEPLPTGELVACMTCGAAVAFTMMTTHTRWHEGRWAEPVEPPGTGPIHGPQNKNVP